MNRTIRWITTLWLLAGFGSAGATDFCVTNSAELQSALSSADSNSQNDLIRVAEGFYTAPSGGFLYDGPDTSNLTISGGWTEFFGNPCGIQFSVNPYATMLDGDDLWQVMQIIARGAANITVSHLTFGNGWSAGEGSSGGGLEIYGWTDYNGIVRVEYTAFLSNHARFGSALSIGRGSKVTVRNSMFLLNVSEYRHTVSIVNNDATGVYFHNNSVLYNESERTDEFALGGVYISVGGSSQAFVANNLIWGNELNSMDFNGDGFRYYVNNNQDNPPDFADQSANNHSIAPRFAGGLLNFRLHHTSELVNKGRMPPEIFPIPVPFWAAWSLGDTDFSGQLRVTGPVVDIGAYEAIPPDDLIFFNGFF